MKHFGDITKINGYEVPIVDVVTGGSPCQDLSVGGKRRGLSGERSGLFMEQVRIVKEMREHDRKTNEHRGNDVRPRYMVWENVPGALTSNKGEDFRVVLEEICKIADSSAVVPRPSGGKWSSAGCIMGDGWSIAFRIHDNQFWGTPQRRRRIALVADFGGASAPEILFERKSVCRDIEKSGDEGENSSRPTEDCVGGCDSERMAYTGGGYGELVEGVGTLRAKGGDYGGGSETLIVQKPYQKTVGTICQIIYKGVSNQIATEDQLIVADAGVRRLTPLECERLQGFPDEFTNIGDWTDSTGKVHKYSDAPRFMALGNSIALPFWKWMSKKMVGYLSSGSTMASLFDGIGGFPLVFQEAGCKPVWASEIEEFPIAVTKIRFPE